MLVVRVFSVSIVRFKQTRQSEPQKSLFEKTKLIESVIYKSTAYYFFRTL